MSDSDVKYNQNFDENARKFELYCKCLNSFSYFCTIIHSVFPLYNKKH